VTQSCLRKTGLYALNKEYTRCMIGIISLSQ
jgi:hypothetical protein